MRLFKRNRTWWVSYYDGTGKRRQVSTRLQDKKAAEARARQLERDVADPDHAATNQATLTQALQLLLDQRDEDAKAGRRSAATAKFYRGKAGHLVRVLEYDEAGTYVPFHIVRLHARDVDRYISQRRQEGAQDSTIQKELVTLRSGLKIAKRRGLWKGDLGQVMPVQFSAGYKPRRRALTFAELHKLVIELLPDQAARVVFIVATSANWHETELALRSDIADDRSMVHLRGTKAEARNRQVPVVGPFFLGMLEYAFTHAGGQGDALFKPWSNARRDLAEACKRAGIDHCSFNDLRRTYATWLRSFSVPLELIAPAMGHADTRMVERVYGKLSPGALKARMEGALGLDVPALVVSPQTALALPAPRTPRPCITGATALGETDEPAGLGEQAPTSQVYGVPATEVVSLVERKTPGGTAKE